MGSKRARFFFLFVGLLFFHVFYSIACGPDFPNQMLDRGDEAVLAAPIADFSRELQRIHVAAAYHAVLSSNSYSSQTIEADLADLRASLKSSGASKTSLERIILDYQAARLQLASADAAAKPDSDQNGETSGETPAKVERKIVNILIPEGLPGEFEDYFRGSIAWHANQTNEARMAWEALLKRPEAERHYRSTWAAYMLGKSWEGTDEKKAAEYFQQVRSLTSARYADHLGLSTASLGLEARGELRQKHFGTAIDLYLQQLASGDESAVNSLRFAAARALDTGGTPLIDLATNTERRRVITAFITSHKLEALFYDVRGYGEDDRTSNSAIILQWLNAVEVAGVKDVESAEQMALAAYQSGQWKLAERWIRRGKSTPVSQWLEAKLLLRAGKLKEAAVLLEHVARLFPSVDDVKSDLEPAELENNLHMPGSTYTSGTIGSAAQVLAEVGVLRLARREYTESLDALLRSGFLMDASYVAERVLTLDELKNYVDRNWPATMEVVTNLDAKPEEDRWGLRRDVRRDIRFLLARRLTRNERIREAREYYPAEQLHDFDLLVRNLEIEGNSSSSKEQRTAALIAAAKIIRYHGLELISTEVEPDWHIHYGLFEEGVDFAYRATNDSAKVLFASKDEIERARKHKVVPEARYSYRYQAASLAWEAAALMPDNTEETARVLCMAGSWLKYLDPKTADIFYKSLVRRCRKTEIGRLADRMRWFPDLDEQGNPVPWKSEPPVEVSPTEFKAEDNTVEHASGFYYLLRRGNTLQDVVEAVQASHQFTVSTEEIQRANPLINPNRLKAGLKIFVPAPPSDNLLPSTEEPLSEEAQMRPTEELKQSE